MMMTMAEMARDAVTSFSSSTDQGPRYENPAADEVSRIKESLQILLLEKILRS